MHLKTRIAILVCYLVLTCWIDRVSPVGNVGCLFNMNVCELDETCVDDNAFGRCESGYDSEGEYYKHSLDVESMKLLEKELARLLDGGYRWDHDYTQCVVQNILYSHQHKLSYDPGLCSRIMMMTLPEVPPDVLHQLEDIDVNDLALIKFTPNRDDGNENFIYAEESFVPSLRKEQESKESNTPSEEEDVEKKRISKKLFAEDRSTFQPPDQDALFRRLLEVAKDTERLFDLPDDFLRSLPSNKPVESIKTSEFNQRPIFSEGGVDWLPYQKSPPKVEDDSAEERGPFDGNQQDNFFRSYDDETRHGNDFDSLVRNFDVDDSEMSPNFKRDNKEPANVWRFSHKKPEEKDRLRKYKIPVSEKVEDDDKEGDGDKVEKSETNYYEGDFHGFLPLESVLPAFQRSMRYDTKKPGFTYFYHEDDDGVSNENVEQKPNKNEAILAQLMAESQQKQLDRLLGDSVETPTKPDKGFSSLREDSSMKEQLHIEFTPEDIKAAERNDTDNGDGNVKRTYQDVPMTQPEVENPLPYMMKIPANKEQLDNLGGSGEGQNDQYESIDATRTYLLMAEKGFSRDEAEKVVKALEKLLALPRGTFSDTKVDGNQITFKVNPNPLSINASDTAAKAGELFSEIKKASGFTVESAGIGNQVHLPVRSKESDRKLFILTFVLCGAVVGSLFVVAGVYVVRRHARSKEKLQNIAQPDREASHDYQDLCRQRMASKTSEGPEAVHSAFSPKKIRSLSQGEGAVSSSSHSSTSSWNEEPVTSNMDISTGHMILSYMEDHLKKKDRLDREWEAMCAYEAEPCATATAMLPQNVKKNRYPDVLPYDHSRVVLNELSNVSSSDYINASSITDHDPRNPAYVATQGPLPHTAADFWQMVWEQGSVVMVMLTRLMENGVAMCHRHWPEEGSEVYHIYEVHLVSEHIWCDDYLVRSFYLKNLRTGETRTVTQFHFLSWPDNGVPNSTKALLEFRRKVNKSYRGRSCPIVVHCSDGIGRSGTYILIDMVLNRMAKGAKEIDIAATLEHIRDQRAGMVKTKAQFEFVLMAIAEEVHAILKALSQ